MASRNRCRYLQLSEYPVLSCVYDLSIANKLSYIHRFVDLRVHPQLIQRFIIHIASTLNEDNFKTNPPPDKQQVRS